MAFSIVRHRRTVVLACALVAGLAGGSVSARAGDRDDGFKDPKWILMPAIPGWFDGKPSLYISTDTSDQGAAVANHLNYAPTLANAANTGAVDDIYTITNFKQSNIVPSSPQPEGPANTNTSYSPLWQLSMVTWHSGATPHLLTSEKAVLAARDAGQVSVTRTNIVINCPIIYTSGNGVFPGAHVIDVGR